VLWVGAGLAIVAAVLLAYVPRLPSTRSPAGLGLTSGSLRITPSTNRRLRVFATTQIAFSFVLLAGAGTLLATLVSLQMVRTGFDMRQVLAFDVPMSATGFSSAQGIDFSEAMRRIGGLPGVEGVSAGMTVPWRDAGVLPRFQFTVEGYTPANGEENPHARFRVVAPRFFAVLGVPIIAGREFADDDGAGREHVVIVSRSVAQRLFPNGDAVNRKLWWTDSLASLFGESMPSRIVGIAADVDDENVVPAPSMAVYVPTRQIGVAERLFVRSSGNPYPLVPAVTRVIHEMSPDQAVERAATLEDVRDQVLSPERLNAFVFTGFAGIALLIAVVGVAGVLAFSVSARTREFGVRLAVGASPAHLLARVLAEGLFIAAIGIAAGAAGGYALAHLATKVVENTRLPGGLPATGAAAVLIAAAVVASLMPAARASRVDVVQALRCE
jgi:predicted permease